MAAFDRIKSGLPGLDQVFDSIRIGDNVVWQVDNLEEFQFVVNPFIKQALADGRNLNYIRFANHKPFLEPQEGVHIYEFSPEDGFESFTMAVRKAITKEGKDAFYVFDCLSNLQVQWSTDLMMGNFFRVTCPYLFDLDTVAYFPIIRGEHSHDAIKQIHDTTQLFTDVYSADGDYYIKPSKVWERSSDTMFLPHHYNEKTGMFDPVMEGAEFSRYYQIVDQKENLTKNQDLDSWDRFVTWAKLEYSQGRCSAKTKRTLCENMMSRDPQIKKLLLKYYTAEDYFMLYNRLIGSGGVGGKACGMLLSRKLVQVYLPELSSKMEPHDSYYIGSDVFYTYIVYNGYWTQRIKQRTREGYFAMADELKECFVSGEFPPVIRRQFTRMLEYFGHSPIIVRSSSLQEDGFGNAFAGKYESVFCVNAGSIEERLEALENAVRTVYASTMDRSALEYRRQRGLEDTDEQMAILVQRVSGNFFGDFFMPHAAGVGYSCSAYRWDPEMDPTAGMLRLVVGLGTQAVDRTGGYPRLVSLDRPDKSPLVSTAERHKFSQGKIDLLDFNSRTLHSRRVTTMQNELPDWYKKKVLEHDRDAERMFLDRGQHREVLFASCHGLVENEQFITDMKSLLHMMQEQYKYPVDIEFTVNFKEDGAYVFNLLQCRPLQSGKNEGKVTIPKFREKDIAFEIENASMGGSCKMQLDYIVNVSPKMYYQFPYTRKYEIAQAVGKINVWFKEHQPDAKIMLLSPGRIGTSSPDLGVPVSFADITQFHAICEISDSSTGYMPELSYGSHMFQDLVEAGIFYSALFENAKTKVFHRDFFQKYDNKLATMFPELAEYQDILQICDVSDSHIMLFSDVMNERTVCGYYKSVKRKSTKAKGTPKA